MAAFFMAIFFLFMAICMFTDQSCFMGKRAKALEGEKRKKFRRVQALKMLLYMVWLMGVFVAEWHMGLDLMGQKLKPVFIGSCVVVIFVTFCVEYFYFRRLNQSE